ncbi:MAG TPA: uracil-DNA glycosylase [Candidatus Limnocylindrales bacterium]|jgi:uracil-DNA glycosylase|nr:uracil-DNA glycosylase [Candidatus Limnocylindrales bacterium]
MTAQELAEISEQVVACTRCPRLVAWREAVAADPPRRFAGQPYWARPLPGFGDPAAGILVVGLAPAAHGGNRTGRIFTGDRSGDFLFAALYQAGLANQPTSTHPGDGLRVAGLYIAAVNRCAPPANLPTPDERASCRPYLVSEMAALEHLKVIVCLGAIAWQGALQALVELGHPTRPRPSFGHGAEASVGPYRLLGCFHPSQQNTFTGRLTLPMMVDVFERARALTA